MALAREVNTQFPHFLDHDLKSLANGYSFAMTEVGEMLPVPHQIQYTDRFAHKLLACMVTMSWKLAQQERSPRGRIFSPDTPRLSG